MNNFSEPFILTDKSRLQEIYDLRVLAWENSPDSDNINSTKYPNGFSDQLEDKSIHIISTDARDTIVGAARLTICDALDELPYPGIFKAYEHLMPAERPFLFYSRLVVHPDYRKTELRKMFDDFRINYMLNSYISFALASAKPKRVLQILPYGFQEIGITSNKIDPNYPFSDHALLLLILQKNIQL